jgi:3-oxoacyl-[acyl-carrier protein] reductase
MLVMIMILLCINFKLKGMNSLAGKVAYITGGSKGIGFGIAKALLSQGMRIAITSRTKEAAEKAASQLGSEPEQILAMHSDVSSMVSEQQAIDAVIKKFGTLDVLIANAGVGHFAPIDQLTEQDWKETIDTNLTGVFNSVKASIDPLKNSKGYIITIASLAGLTFLKLLRPIMQVSLDWWAFPRLSCLTFVNMELK